ncbi:MAG: class I SAM-dependent methyltransferase [Desulfamplus sp.]|nr:class I SAM-dependent methyltransferase [Desulfamplus sp.]
MIKIDVIWYSPRPLDICETIFSFEYCRKTTKQLLCRHFSISSWQSPGSLDEFVACLNPGNLPGDFTLLISNPEVIIAPMALERMILSMADSKDNPGYGASVVIPVYNESPCRLQVAELPAVYINLSTYIEVAGLMKQGPIGPVPGDGFPLDLSCLLLGKVDLEVLSWCAAAADGKDHDPGVFMDKDAGSFMDKVTARFVELSMNRHGCALVPSALVHRFGIYGQGYRRELAELVPDSAVEILDVGCARGGFGELLKQNRPERILTGIEMNPAMAAQARVHYDHVHIMKVEDVRFDGTFDHINCGDVMEHLYDPWAVLGLFHSLLNEDGGSLVISLPNAGHWSIVKDLARGRFQYLPFGLLCITHIRWFTEESILQALGDAGFEIDHLHREQIPPTPAGEAFIKVLCDNGMGDRCSLLTNQLTIRAWRR